MFVFLSRLYPPDQRLDRFKLTEVKREIPDAGGAVVPVFEQAARDTGNTGIIGAAPRIDATADFIDTVERFSAARVIAHIENFVAGRPALLHL